MKLFKSNIKATLILILLLTSLSHSAENQIFSKLLIDRDVISSAMEAITLINKSKLIPINSLTSESLIVYDDLLKQLNSPSLKKESDAKLYELYSNCIKAHRNFILESKIRIKDNLDLIAELKEIYPDVFKSTFCIDSITKYNEVISAIENNKTDDIDLYEIIKLIIISDRTFANDINEFKTK